MKERQSDQPTWVPIMLSICEAELEGVSGDEREQHQTRLTNNVQWWRTAVAKRAGTRSVRCFFALSRCARLQSQVTPESEQNVLDLNLH